MIFGDAHAQVRAHTRFAQRFAAVPAPGRRRDTFLAAGTVQPMRLMVFGGGCGRCGSVDGLQQVSYEGIYVVAVVVVVVGGDGER